MPHRFLPVMLSAAVIVLSLAACSYLVPTREVLVTVLPTPLLTPAPAFYDGVSEVPDGHAAFIEYWKVDSGEGNCEEGAELAHFEPGYEFTNQRLSAAIDVPASNRSRIIVGTQSIGRGPSCCIDFGGLTVIDLLPYELDAEPVRIIFRAVEESGVLIVEIDGQAFQIHPGSSWEYTVKESSEYSGQPRDCWTTMTETLTNHGFLRDEDIALEFWDGVAYQPFQPGMVLPTPAPEAQ